VNQLGVFLGMKAVLPSMLKAGKDSIVNISSVAGLVAIYGAPNLAYVASKFAVRGMTKQVARSTARRTSE
jgi:3alpha(or 20beta)-hydroxysteroid dehydrogenase